MEQVRLQRIALLVACKVSSEWISFGGILEKVLESAGKVATYVGEMIEEDHLGEEIAAKTKVFIDS